VKHEQPPFIKSTSLRKHSPGNSITESVYTKNFQEEKLSF